MSRERSEKYKALDVSKHDTDELLVIKKLIEKELKNRGYCE